MELVRGLGFFVAINGFFKNICIFSEFLLIIDGS